MPDQHHPGMELRQLRYFVAAAEEENFHRAARRLNIAQPALSRQIALLEAELGVQLFIRAERRVRLSAPGRLYLAEASKILADVALANERLRQASAGAVGVLRLGFHETAGRSEHFSRSVQNFRARFPGVELRLTQMTSQQQVEQLIAGSLDAGFLYRDFIDPAGLGGVEVATDRFYFAVRQDHPLAGRAAVELAELQAEPFVRISRYRNPRFYDALLRACAAAGFAPNVLQETESEATLINLVAIGMGAAFVVSSSSASWRQDVVLIPVRDLTVCFRLALMWNAAQPSAFVANFVDSLVTGE